MKYTKRLYRSTLAAWRIIIKQIKREVRCKSGAIPVAVRGLPKPPSFGGAYEKLQSSPLFLLMGRR
jgi:hypothetical protein